MEKKESFEVTDVRELTENLLPMLLKKAGKVTVGDGMCVVHSFELVPLKPLALLNVKEIDNGLADLMVHFWDFVWGREKPAIDEKTKYLLSLANGVGAGRFRQATRELVIWNTPDQLRAMMTQEQADFVSVPSNVASTFYNKGTDLKLLRISVWGVFYVIHQYQYLCSVTPRA